MAYPETLRMPPRREADHPRPARPQLVPLSARSTHSLWTRRSRYLLLEGSSRSRSVTRHSGVWECGSNTRLASSLSPRSTPIRTFSRLGTLATTTLPFRVTDLRVTALVGVLRSGRFRTCARIRRKPTAPFPRFSKTRWTSASPTFPSNPDRRLHRHGGFWRPV